MLVFIDTCAYLRLAKRIRPFVGTVFGQKKYVITIHKTVEDEVHRNSRLKHLFPWFDQSEHAQEGKAQQIRLTTEDKRDVELAQSVLRGEVLNDLCRYTQGGRSPPSETDCFLLALAQKRAGIVVTDDLSMHELAGQIDLTTWHGYELLHKMKSAKLLKSDQIREIYAALEANNDLPQSWSSAKWTHFDKIFAAK